MAKEPPNFHLERLLATFEHKDRDFVFLVNDTRGKNSQNRYMASVNQNIKEILLNILDGNANSDEAPLVEN